jgi:hypothetical protein
VVASHPRIPRVCIRPRARLAQCEKVVALEVPPPNHLIAAPPLFRFTAHNGNGVQVPCFRSEQGCQSVCWDTDARVCLLAGAGRLRCQEVSLNHVPPDNCCLTERG